jgi:hypothetical protein
MGAKFEAFLASLYTDKEMRIRFLSQPDLEARNYGLSEDEILDATKIDRDGLIFASRSLAKKRQKLAGAHSECVHAASGVKAWLQKARRLLTGS